MPNGHSRRRSATAPSGQQSVEVRRPPRSVIDDFGRVMASPPDTPGTAGGDGYQTEDATDGRRILFVAGETSSPTRIWVIPAGR